MYIMFKESYEITNDTFFTDYIYFEEKEDVSNFQIQFSKELITKGLEKEKIFYYFSEEMDEWVELKDLKIISKLNATLKKENREQIQQETEKETKEETKEETKKEIKNFNKLNLYITFTSGETVKTNNKSLTAHEIGDALEFLLNSKIMGENVKEITIKRE